MRARRIALLVVLLVGVGAALSLASSPLVTLEQRVTGMELRVTPGTLSVPKGVRGSVAVELVSGDGTRSEATRALARGAVVEATLRGPSFPARRLLSAPDAPLVLPPLPLVGDYRLDEIRLVDEATGTLRLDASPRSVPVQVFDEVLVSRVTSRPLGLEEIEERGIAIDESSFQVVEFEVGFVLDGEVVPVRFPVVSPRLVQSTEIVPRAEVEALLAQAEQVNRELGEQVELPPALEAAHLGFEVRPLNLQMVIPSEGGLELQVPPIPALLMIPGRIGLLNQFFSVQLFTQNASPAGSGLSVHSLEARLALPVGYDGVPGTPDAPGDDPLRFARIGPDRVVEPVQRVVSPGPDGVPGSADDVARLLPGRTGQAEFLVEGLDEGLHVLDVELAGTLDGFAAGPVQITGRAAGSVLVRNPSFSMAFSHPRTIRAGEPYTASVTVLNTSPAPAHRVSVTLPGSALSGATFEPGTSERAELDTIAPGATATATWRLRAQRTGAITFSQLIGDENLIGRFRLRMGVDERGVELSPDGIGYPEAVYALETAAPDLFAAANRVLGQALSVGTAAVLPPGVRPITRRTLEQRVVELAEAGQRLRYGDRPERVWFDLLLDWQGARAPSEGFDQLLRETDAGREWREALGRVQEEVEGVDAVARVEARAVDLAGRGENFGIASSGTSTLEPVLAQGDAEARLDRSDVAGALAYRGSAGHILVARQAANVRFEARQASGPGVVAWLALEPAGAGRLLRWTTPALAAGDCLRSTAGAPGIELALDEGCDGTTQETLLATEQAILEAAPEVLAALQDLRAPGGRPSVSCLRQQPSNYGTLLAVLFSKPVTKESAAAPAAYRLDDGKEGRAVAIQPGGRVALVNLSLPVGRIRPVPPAERRLRVVDVRDLRGNAVIDAAVPVALAAEEGVALRGVVVGTDGAPARGLPVTLTMHDEAFSFSADCLDWTRRIAQVPTDEAGRFAFDFVLSGIPFTVSATDTRGLSAAAAALLLEASVGGDLDAARLEELVERSPGTLLAEFAAGGLPRSIALAEGVDRALFRDLVPEDHPREGTEVPIALRFRGRGAVEGAVLAPDGVTPVAGAAVNLFPDPDSREKGRGVTTDASGRFSFAGVPLGLYALEVTGPTGLGRVVSGSLGTPGEVDDVPVVLSEQLLPRTTVRGRVLEADGRTPHPGGRVLVGIAEGGRDGPDRLREVVALVDVDAAGRFEARGVPVGTWSVVAISVDGRRSGAARDVRLFEGVEAFADVLLPDRTELAVQVRFANGDPVRDALVSGGEMLVETDDSGLARVPGVPTGRRTLAAGYRGEAAHPDPRRRTTRIASAEVEVVGGISSVVTLTLPERGSVFGQVRDASGRPVGGVHVSIPVSINTFAYTKADAQGRFEFADLALGEYTVSAPAPAIPEDDVSGILALLEREPSEEELQAAIGEAFTIFTGVNDPLLNPVPFNPLTWGYTRVRLDADGVARRADVDYLAQGTVRGTVLNGQGVPIGARVRLTGVGPDATGDVTTVIRGERNSDPATGTFVFEGQALEGSIGLQAASPFFPNVITAGGQITDVELEPPPFVLRFPPVSEVNGRITGTVRDPDGAPVAGARVRIHVSSTCSSEDESGCLVRITDENGRFGEESTLFGIPAFRDGFPASYFVEATDEAGSLRVASAIATLAPATTTDVSLRLLAPGGASIQVLQAGGAPAAGATVRVTGSAYPNESLEGLSDENGAIRFGDATIGSFPLPEGRYAVEARFVAGATAIRGRASLVVERGAISAATVVLGPTAAIRGRFVDADGTTPIGFARVRVGTLAVGATDAEGRFEWIGMPLGSHRVIGQDAVTGRLGEATVVLSRPDETREVVVRVRPSGEIAGAVVASDGSRFVPAASVTLRSTDGGAPERAATTDPGGLFSFPGAPAGSYQLSAEDTATGVRGVASVVLAEGAAQVRADVRLEPRAGFTVRVFAPDGVTPAPARVSVSRPLAGPIVAVDTDPEGRAAIADLPLGTFVVRAESRNPGESRSVAEGGVTLTRGGLLAEEVPFVLNGVGAVSGRVFEADGTTLASGSTVEIFFEGALHSGQSASPDLAGGGSFVFSNVPVGAFRIAARRGGLGATARGAIDGSGDARVVDLVLGESGSVFGRVVAPDGRPVIGAQVVLGYSPESAAADTTLALTNGEGRFRFDAIPVGAVTLATTDAASGGVRMLALPGDPALLLTAQGLDLGDVVLDVEPPEVIETAPPDGAVGVPTDAVFTLTMSEHLRRTSDPEGIDPSGVFLRKGSERIASRVELDAADATRLRVTSAAPLESETVYELVVVNGELRSAVGEIVARGPRDLADRPLRLPFTARFTTRDDDPPGLLSLTPVAGAEQVDPSAVVRLSFDEPLDPAGIVVELRDASGTPVPGRVSLGVGDQVVVLTPAAFLAPNRRYTVSVSGVRDRAGNPAEGQPFVSTFDSVDTLGPAIAALAVADTAPLVAGASVEIAATLLAPEPGVALRMSADLVDFGRSEPGVLALPLVLPERESVMVRAVAIDRFGNEGPLAELPLTIRANEPPTVSFTRIAPPSGPVATGSSLEVEVRGEDDARVARLRARAEGAGFLPLTTSDGEPLRLSIPVSPDAGPGSRVTLVAEAIDESDATSGEATLSVEVIDGTPPLLALPSLEPGALLDPGETISVRLQAGDAFGVATIALGVEGPASGGGEEIFLEGPAQAEVTFPVRVDPDATGDQLVVLTGTARDVSDLSAEPQSVWLGIRDESPPQVLSSTPPDGAIDVSLDASIEIVFSEPLAAASVTAGSVSLEAEGGDPVPVFPSLSADGRSVALLPFGPLDHGRAYVVRVSTLVSDRGGNPLGSPFVSRFTTVPDLVGPRLLELWPPDGAEDVSTAAAVFAHFDEAVDPVSVSESTLRILDVAAGDVPVTTETSLEAGGLRVVTRPTSPLALDRAYVLELAPPLRGLDGNPVRGNSGEAFGTSLRHAFRTARFGITSPRDGATVTEGESLVVEAEASTTLGVASVRFSMDESVLPLVTAAPFRTRVDVPPLDASATLRIRAEALDAGGAVLGSDEIRVSVGAGLRLDPPILGVPRGGMRPLRIELSSPARSDVLVQLSVVDPSVARAREQVTLPSGSRSLEIDVEGLESGATALVATTELGSVGAAVSVSVPVAGEDESVFTAIGAPISPAPSAGQLYFAAPGTASLTLPLLALPATASTPVLASSTAPDVVRVVSAAAIAAGTTATELRVEATSSGVAVLVLRAGMEVRQIVAVVGPPPLGVRDPLRDLAGAVVQPSASSGEVHAGENGVHVVVIPLLASPAGAFLPVTVVTSDAAVARVDSAVSVVSGSQVATVPITTGRGGVAILTFTAGSETRVVVVRVGEHEEDRRRRPASHAGAAVQRPFLRVFLEPGETRTLTVDLAPYPALFETSGSAASRDADIAVVTPGAFAWPAGAAQSQTFTIAAGNAPGVTAIDVRVGDGLRAIQVVVGDPLQVSPPQTLAPPAGVRVGP